MEIRFFDQNDSLLEISNIYESSWKYAYQNIIPQDYLDRIPTGRWAESITKAGMRNLVIIESGRMIGTASICPSRWEQYPEYGEIVSIYFLPEYMEKGYGAYLLKRCVAELQKLGFEKILLWVLEDNIRARKFYEKHGLVCADVYRNDQIGGKELREVMYVYSCDPV